MTEKLQLSNGELVIKNKISISSFLKQVIQKAGGNRRYSGSEESLIQLAEDNLDNYTPGTGSENGDVRLLNVPAESFLTGIVKITPENAHNLTVRYDSRVEGEQPYPQLVMLNTDYTPATHVQLVVYRADVLAKDNNRSSDTEWEIVAILANPSDKVPMNPSTMARNASHSAGGTQRNYTPEEWLEATTFWQQHAVIAEETQS